MRDRASIAFVGVAIASLGAVATALVHQYAFDMLPCAWCVLQRLIFLAIAVVSALGLWLQARPVRNTLAAVIALLAGSGIASAWYQHVSAADRASCHLSLAQRLVSYTLHLDTVLPSVFAIRVGCAAGATALLGIRYEFWSLSAFALLAIAAFLAMRGSRMPNLR